MGTAKHPNLQLVALALRSACGSKTTRATWQVGKNRGGMPDLFCDHSFLGGAALDMSPKTEWMATYMDVNGRWCTGACIRIPDREHCEPAPSLPVIGPRSRGW